mmetsp:Transcript_68653/g.183240  ORF Transcript_68653/g.183240 Transcript_68653/m.183240 type:complete len:261 (-) Transcript_68653:1134-1916(-)
MLRELLEQREPRVFAEDLNHAGSGAFQVWVARRDDDVLGNRASVIRRQAQRLVGAREPDGSHDFDAKLAVLVRMQQHQADLRREAEGHKNQLDHPRLAALRLGLVAAIAQPESTRRERGPARNVAAVRRLSDPLAGGGAPFARGRVKERHLKYTVVREGVCERDIHNLHIVKRRLALHRGCRVERLHRGSEAEDERRGAVGACEVDSALRRSHELGRVQHLELRVSSRWERHEVPLGRELPAFDPHLVCDVLGRGVLEVD